PPCSPSTTARRPRPRRRRPPRRRRARASNTEQTRAEGAPTPGPAEDRAMSDAMFGDDYKPDDVVRATHRQKSGEGTYTPRVPAAQRGTDRHDRPGWWLTLAPCRRPDSGQFQSASVHVPDVPAAYGVQTCEVVGTERPEPPPYSPRPRDPGYDLMH